MGSSRLPGKVLMDTHGRPALAWLVERLRAVPQLDDIILATTTSPGDAELAAWAEANGVACHRGSEEDVLGRVVGAQQQAGGDIVLFELRKAAFVLQQLAYGQASATA